MEVVRPSVPAEDWEVSWARLIAQLHSPANDKATAAALETLAVSDPVRALALAGAERNRQRRSEWLRAALRGWASVAPDAAAAWIFKQSTVEREEAEQAVMDGAVCHPEAAVALADKLMREDPTYARSHANQLLRVLSEAGNYERGVEFASKLPEEIRTEMLGTAFQYWALAQPERAFAEAVKLPAGDTRSTALDAAISGWAQGDPSGLSEFALSIPAADDRAAVLQTALREWVLINPKAASQWIDQFDPKPELDAGAAAVALQPDVVSARPEIAASWAESITRPELRSSTLASVLREWAAKDTVAALNYARSSPALQSPDRMALIDEFTLRPPTP
jgi:hypothetical protein